LIEVLSLKESDLNFDELDKLKERLDSLRPLPEAVVKNLREELILRLWCLRINAWLTI